MFHNHATPNLGRPEPSRKGIQEEETISPAPSLLNFVDLASGLIGGQVTPGNIGTINDHRRKLDPLVADEGICFIDSATQTEYQVTAIQKDKPSQLLFHIPVIPASL